jgi:ketosteroid isomerase-like protein
MWVDIAAALPDLAAWEAAIERWWHPELVYEEDPSWPGAGTHRGRDQVRAAFEGYSEVMGIAEFSLEQVEPLEDGVVALVRVRGDSAAGVPWDHLWGYACRARDGQLVYLRAYWDPEEALAAGGAS